jgi:8-oxo-dGTP pyrophosphatase MutT (NUDIX family)
VRVSKVPPYPQQSYYRVSCKALIFDDQGQLLVSKDINGEWEIPGGGWDHEETYDACIRRELDEELEAKVTHIGPLSFFYRCETEHGHPKISLAFLVELASHNFKPNEGELVEARFVTRDEFLQLPFQQAEHFVQEWADQIWPAVEKNSVKR